MNIKRVNVYENGALITGFSVKNNENKTLISNLKSKKAKLKSNSKKVPVAEINLNQRELWTIKNSASSENGTKAAIAQFLKHKNLKQETKEKAKEYKTFLARKKTLAKSLKESFDFLNEKIYLGSTEGTKKKKVLPLKTLAAKKLTKEIVRKATLIPHFKPSEIKSSIIDIIIQEENKAAKALQKELIETALDSIEVQMRKDLRELFSMVKLPYSKKGMLYQNNKVKFQDLKERFATVRSVVLKGKELKKLPRSFALLSGLQNLDLSNNKLKTLSTNLLDRWPNLEKLGLRNNKLSSERKKKLKEYCKKRKIELVLE